MTGNRAQWDLYMVCELVALHTAPLISSAGLPLAGSTIADWCETNIFAGHHDLQEILCQL